MSGFFRGTSVDTDSRFKDKKKLQLKRMAFPPHFERRLDIGKVQLAVIEPWVSGKVMEALGVDDDILTQFVMSQLTAGGKVDPKAMQIDLTGFLESSAPAFMSELWRLLLSAQVGGGVSCLKRHFEVSLHCI
ncbi:PWI domain-containing protein [Pavlovales sp. CCMP2436]|nr:PWI domain-containing protein [Pavlovales sp. CCMP2436]